MASTPATAASSERRGQGLGWFMLLAVVVAFVPAASAPGSAPEHQFVGMLGHGDALFWDGPYIESVGTGTRLSDEFACHSPAATMIGCDVVTGYAQPTAIAADFGTVFFEQDDDPFCDTEHACLTYEFDVLEKGNVLRVALDQETLRDLIFVYLFDPEGTYVTKLNSAANRAEARIQQPAVGRWTAQVRVYDARDTSFRMRAALDPEDGRPSLADVGAEPDELLPNLQVIAPFEVGFAQCQATEIADYGAKRCLRFSTGPANVGEGSLDLLVTEVGEIEGQMYQRIHHTDGTTKTVDAGLFDYHHEHLHYHHGALQSLELLRVTDATQGRMELAGTGPKLGFCLLPYFVADWTSFAQAPSNSAYGDNGCADYTGLITPPVGTQMALAQGWADIYGWYIEGNFVDFADNPDGLYVIRAQSDPDSDVVESNEHDNTSYTYLRVTGDDVEVIERGVGNDPWDANKVLVDDNRRPTIWVE